MGGWFPLTTRLEIGALLNAGVPRGTQTILAKALGVTTRTLRNWMDLAAMDEAAHRPPGRPPLGPEQHERARECVADVLAKVGYGAGEAVVMHELGGAVSLALVRSALRELKAEHERSRERVLAEQRVHVEVLARNAIWSLDGTHLGRDDEGRAMVAEIVHEVASTSTLGASIGPPPTSDEVRVLLERVSEEAGELPLVLAHDNGGENRGAVVAWCREHDVVELQNLPHTPQHNPWVERGNRDLKEEARLGKGCVLGSVEDVANELASAAIKLDTCRPRASRGWRTARETYLALPSAEHVVDRQAFVRDATCATRRAVKDSNTWRARRMAERHAILHTMESYGLVTRTRGQAPMQAGKAEGVS